MSSVTVCAPDPKHGRGYLGPSHSVAAVARRRCRAVHRVPAYGLIGGVACGKCWERAIRADERIAAQFDLESEVRRDPELVDEIAVERALQGEAVSLTRFERQEVNRRRSQQDKRSVGGGVKTGRLVSNRRNDKAWVHYAEHVWPQSSTSSEAVTP